MKNGVFSGWTAKISLSIFIVIILASIFAQWLTPHDPNKTNIERRLENPSLEYKLGTDQMGRDLLTRILHGGRTSIGLAIMASVLSMIVGLIIGLISGYYGGIIDNIFLFITNIMQGLPSLAFMIALVSVMDQGIKSIVIVLVITSWCNFSRIVRGEVLKISKEDFVEGIRSLGAGNMYIILCHILPNLIGTIIVIFTARVSRSVLTIASLSFLGFGLQPPTPDWGVMVRDALNYFRSYPMLIIAPGSAVFLTSLSINMIGDTLRDFFDVRLSNGRL